MAKTKNDLVKNIKFQDEKKEEEIPLNVKRRRQTRGALN
jgi:hypothetical protein